MFELVAALRGLFEYVGEFESSIALRESLYLFPWIIVAHVLSVFLFAGTVMMMDLRLVGVGNMRKPFSQIQRRLFPWQMAGMGIATISGLTLVYANPMSYFANVIFWSKMLAIAMAGVNALAFHFVTEHGVAGSHTTGSNSGFTGRRRTMYEYFAAIAAWPISRYINESYWIFAFVQALHFITVAVLSGAVLLVDLRLLGHGITEQPVSRIARDARPWLIGSLIGTILTGVPQFISLATKEYESPNFWYKMLFFGIAVLFTFTIRDRVIGAPDGRFGPVVIKGVAATSIALWIGVAIEGRLIGFFS